MNISEKASTRKGIVLLLVLAILAAFGLIVLAYVVLTGHTRRGAEAAKRFQEQYDPPQQVVEQVLMQVLRGSNDPHSSIWCHSLLEDMYGDRGQNGRIAGGTPVNLVAGGQLWAFAPSFDHPQEGEPWEPSFDELYKWVGSVITFIDPPLAGISSRVLGLGYDPPNNLIQVAAPNTVPIDAVNSVLIDQEKPIRFILNGAPFSGTGMGTEPADMQFALTPNPTVREFVDHWAGAGDRTLLANEDYDAADYQNMFLAMGVPDTILGNLVVPEPSYHRVALAAYWFNQAMANAPDPATRFQRFQQLLEPETIPNNDANKELKPQIALWKRKFVLRPLKVFHPYFDGSNPRYYDGVRMVDSDSDGVPDRLTSWEELPADLDNPEVCYPPRSPGEPPPWDVDNDGDGVADSVWVDVGLPARTLPDGRRYKPLAAILCVDLDGRLNLNAHGTLVQTDPRYYQADNIQLDGVPQNANWILAAGNDTDGDTFPDGENPSILPPTEPPESFDHRFRWFRGLGFGPAEVNLGPLFQLLTKTSGSPAGWQTLYAVLLRGRADAVPPIPGRYGERSLLPAAPPFPAPGRTGAGDFLLANKFFSFPADWRLNLPQPFGPGNGTIYGSPPDMMGIMSVGLDLRGRPLYLQPQNLWGVAITDNPYKIDLSPRRGRGVIVAGQQDQLDAPFSPTELEAILRPFDRDSASLPQRLKQLVPDIVRMRHLVTSESWDVPVPSIAGSKRWRDSGGGLLLHIAQRFTVTNPLEWRLLFSPDVAAGLRLDINRPLGDSIDNNNNGVIDEPLESRYGLDGWPYQTPSGPGPAVVFDHDSDGVAGAEEDPRQALARHLYVLMMAVADLTYVDTITGSRTETARMLAQWAVNVVDFRDRDSIMTRFVFDENPFDGWNPTEDLQHTVWGCERPELLISETLAFHDRRTEDLADFGYAYPTENEPKEEEQGDGVKDLDQRYRPQGSLFVELYNPWFENEPVAGEFDNPNKQQPAAQPGVDLAKTNPNGEPIWRLIITRPEFVEDQNGQPTGLLKDPDDPTNGPQIERVVYFTPRPAGGFPEEANVNYYPNNTYAGEIPKILPGCYGIIGPAGQPDGDITYIGFQGEQGEPNTDRYIRILPDQVIVDKNLDTPPAGIKSPVGIRIDRAFVTVGGTAGDKEMRLSVSEPPRGYDALEAGKTDAGGNNIVYNPATGRYENPPGTPQAIDQPLDAQRTDLQQGETWDELFGRNITKTNYRVVHLQRLADPTQPYDLLRNPYRTIDSAPVDLTCFNSRTNDNDFSQDGQVQLDPGDIMFHTRQRGERNDDVLDPNNNTIPETNRDFILWKQEPANKPVTNDGTTVTVGLFNRKLTHTLGYLSEYFGTPRPGPVPYNGDPPRPFPWLTWLNRPFSNPLEVLLVPALPSSRLLAYDQDNYYKFYRVPRDGTNPATDLNPYQPKPNAGPSDPEVANDPYPHLLNFFWSVGAGTGGSNPLAPEFHRILEFIRVPSPFVNMELQMNPIAAASVPPPHGYTPPYHMVSYWREPGRINLNTIYSPEVLRALLNEPGSILTPPTNWDDVDDVENVPIAQLWHRFLDSRRGYPLNNVTTPGWLSKLLEINPDYPTRFGNPFRSFGGYSNVPSDPALQELVEREVNATVLRARVDYDGNTLKYSSVPLFQSDLTNADIQSDPTNADNNHDFEYCDTNRNPFFRYRRLMRLGNLVTTRSNVYAIWITVGYFEVHPVMEVAQPDPDVPGNFLINGMSLTPQDIADIYPDGYMLGQELGSDTGEIQRHRGFFMYDRSIPVGFKRGYDLNVDQGLLIRRIID